MSKRIVIIGGGTAGASAAFSARKTDRTAEITVLNKESYPTYSRCGLPFAIQGIIQPIEKLVVFPQKFFQSQKVNYLGNVLIRSIQTDNKTVVTESGDKYDYDTLVIATGATPLKPPIEGINLPHIFTIRTIDDAQKIISTKTRTGETAVIIGASFIGLEMAEALKIKGYKVTIVEAIKTMWRIVDADVSQIINQHLTDNGIKILEESMVEKITPDSVTVRHTIPTQSVGTTIPATIVIISAGVKPDIELARAAGLDIGPSNGIKTNPMLETSKTGIYTAGDCAESYSAITGEPIVSGLGTIAARQGVVAGANAAGAQLKSPPLINASILKIFHMEIGSAGFTETHLTKNIPPKPARPKGRSGGRDPDRSVGTSGFTPVSILIKYPSLPHYYPGGEDIHTKLIADKESGRILGGQVLGKSRLSGRVDMLSLAIEQKMTIKKLAQADFCYSPPCSDIWNPLAVAAQGLMRKISHR
jgi:NADH oxidase (H2O2-forming)